MKRLYTFVYFFDSALFDSSFKQLLNFFSNEYIGWVFKSFISMVENPEVAGHDLVLQHGPGGDVDPVPVVGDDDHSTPETH